MNEKKTLHEEVKEKFRDFLLANELRQTRERFAILDIIYTHIDGTFTIEDLQEFLLLEKFPVSKSAIYTTTQLLVQANLLIRHPFSSSSAIFERITDDHPKSYQICNKCHRITRIKSKELAEAVYTYRPRRFGITHRILYIYGCCSKCESEMRKRIKQSKKETNK